ncbi:MAG TPA: TetR/AcrR family transcriptional regulator [Solirubrobacteraceae bacterium]|nr:TetR/AcrR family transcriptional regulator [Solirubrobacteraceae bacterium]
MSSSSPALPPAPRRPARTTARQAARRPGLTVEQVVAAAIAVLDEEGVAGLSMRKVAERLGTGAATLYAYVSGREELLELVFDELVGTVALPSPSDPKRWREEVMTAFRSLHAVLVSHRDAALAGLGRIPTTPKTMAASEAMGTVMRAGGLSDRAIALGLDTLMLYVCAAAFEDSMFDRTMSPEDLRAYHDSVDDFFRALPGDQFPVLTSLIEPMTGPDGEERFDFGLEVILAGLEAVSVRERAR